LGVLAVGLDATVLSVALPTLAVSLHASATDLQWFISSYTLALAVALLPGGLLGDRFGRKKVMIIALSVFGLGSLACAYAPNAGAFIAARTVLGLAAGCMIPLVLSVLAVMFTDQERTKAVSVWAAANFLALPIGPILGGWLLSNYWWGWVFQRGDQRRLAPLERERDRVLPQRPRNAQACDQRPMHALHRLPIGNRQHAGTERHQCEQPHHHGLDGIGLRQQAHGDRGHRVRQRGKQHGHARDAQHARAGR